MKEKRSGFLICPQKSTVAGGIYSIPITVIPQSRDGVRLVRIFTQKPEHFVALHNEMKAYATIEATGLSTDGKGMFSLCLQVPSWNFATIETIFDKYLSEDKPKTGFFVSVND